MTINYFVEQINVSDDEYKLIEICCESGDFIKKNQHIFSYESSKSINEVDAVADGYIYFNKKCELDENFKIGFKIAFQSAECILDEDLQHHFTDINEDHNRSTESVRVSKKASELIKSHNLSMTAFDGLEIISEKVVLDLINTMTPKINNLSTYTKKYSQDKFYGANKTRLAVIGSGKAALQLWDSLELLEKYEVVGFYDSNKEGDSLLFGIDVTRGDVIDNVLLGFSKNEFDEVIISFSGDIKARSAIFCSLKDKGVPFANIIHPTATVSKFSNIGEGNVIFANCRIGPFCELGHNNFFSTLSSVEHNNIIGSHNTFGPGVLFSGSVTVGDKNKFGTMIGIEPNVVIGSGNIIASSQVLNISVSDKKLIRSKAGHEVKDL